MTIRTSWFCPSLNVTYSQGTPLAVVARMAGARVVGRYGDAMRRLSEEADPR